MKRFIKNIIIFLAIIAACDYMIGGIIATISTKAVSGEALRDYEIADGVSPDILILGSSRATHHYVPHIIEDSIGYSTYTAGRDGCGILLMWPIMRYMSDRHKPRLVIYDITAGFDILENDPLRDISHLGPLWCRDENVDNIIKEIDPLEALKLRSRLYRYNSMLPTLIRGAYPGEKYSDGYIPLQGDCVPQDETEVSGVDKPISSLKLKFFSDISSYAKAHDIRMIFRASPLYYTDRLYDLSPIVDVIEPYGFEYIDLRSDTLGMQKKEIFRDPYHMNHIGAERLTTSIIPLLRHALQ